MLITGHPWFMALPPFLCAAAADFAWWISLFQQRPLLAWYSRVALTPGLHYALRVGASSPAQELPK